MVAHFFDSSALAKLFLNEAESTAMARFVESTPVQALLCSRLGLLETRSTIRRKLLYRQITSTSALQALRQLEQEMSRWTVLPISEDVLVRAASIIESYGLRTLDAIQLGTALLANTNHGPVTFVLYDRELTDAAQASGLATLAP